jgi:hypothetical protein
LASYGSTLERFGAAASIRASVALILLALILISVAAVTDVLGRSASPEAVVRTYFGALEAEDAERALEQILPEGRARARPFVENAVGNDYGIVGMAVEQVSILDRMGGAPPEPRAVTIFLDIRQKDGTRWQAAPRVPLRWREGRVYLGAAPLQVS